MGVLIEKAQEKLRKDSGAIYYTGYAKFWDTNMADNDYCSKNENSWSFFYNINEPTKVISDRAFLTKDRRQKMNDLVELANKKIKETVEKKDKKNSKGQSNTVFVDFDGYFGDVDGRFCTKGADKPETDRKDEVTFYPLNIWDPMGSGDFKRDEPVEVYNGTFEGQVDSFAALADYSGVHYRTNIPMAKGKAKAKMLAAEPGTPKADVAVAAAGDKVALQKRFSILPDGFGRVFHPTMAGHQIMARLVLYKIAQRNAAGLKKDYGQEVLTIAASDSCPVDTKIPAFEARCTGDDGSASGLPTNVFENYQKGTNVYDEFCKQMDDRKLDYKKPQSWKVNAKGEKQSGSSKVRRTPPPDADAHKQMISMKWTPSTSGECKQSCKDAFKGMARGCGGKGGSLNIMAVRARYNTGCGTFSYEITGDGVPDKAAQCTQAQVKAPKRDRDVTGKGTSVEKAYTQFCEEYDGKTLEDSSTLDRKYKRYGVSSWGVENRVSFWISASFIKGCTGKVTIKKDTCMKKFKGGLDSCDKDNGFSGGFTADEQCIQYLVETGYELRDDGGRWNVNNLPAAYPPPEDTDGIKLK